MRGSCHDERVSATLPPRAGAGEGIQLESTVSGIAREWDELADRAGAVPFVRPGWIQAWWDAFGSGELRILTLRREGRLAAVLPVRSRLGTLTSTANPETPEFCVLAEDDEAVHALARWLVAGRPRYVSLAFVDATRRDLGACSAAARAARYRVLTRTLTRSPYVTVTGDWQAFERGLQKKFVGDIRRRRRRLEEEGAVALTVSDGSERLDELLEEGFRLEASGWKAERGTSIAARPDAVRFYRSVARWAADRGSLRLAFLRVGERAVAFQLALEEDRVYYYLKGGYDPAYRRFAPGKLITHALLEDAFSAGLASYELLGDAEPWKLGWTSGFREKKLFQAFAPSPLGLLGWSVFAYGKPLARRMRLRRALALLRR